MPVTEVQELFVGELRALVGDNDVGYPEPVDDVGEEEDSLFEVDVCDGSSLDPFGEFVDDYQQMGVSTRCPLDRTHEIKATYCEWPSDGDHL